MPAGRAELDLRKEGAEAGAAGAGKNVYNAFNNSRQGPRLSLTTLGGYVSNMYYCKT